ncbi:MAG: hypothetical protein ACKVRN_02715 [Pyrinomonadaceae bacterium]
MKLSTDAQTTLTMSYEEALRPETYRADNDAVSGDIQNVAYARTATMGCRRTSQTTSVPFSTRRTSTILREG